MYIFNLYLTFYIRFVCDLIALVRDLSCSCVCLLLDCAQFHQYQVVGRALPSETDEHPKIYRMKLWATNEVRAKSKFWYVFVCLFMYLADELMSSIFVLSIWIWDVILMKCCLISVPKVFSEEAEEGQEEQWTNARYQ